MDGIYQFTASLYTNDENDMSVDNVIENEILLTINSNLDDNTQASTTVFTECLSFQKVWVETSGN